MFGFLKKQNLRKIQEGKIPFYQYPDGHNNGFLKSMSSMISIISVSNDTGIINIFDSPQKKEMILSFEINSNNVVFSFSNRFPEIDFTLIALKPNQIPGIFTVTGKKDLDIANDIKNLVSMVHSNLDECCFQCFWKKTVTQKSSMPVVPNNDALTISQKDIADIEVEFGVSLPDGYRQFILNHSFPNSKTIETLFFSKEKLRATNSFVRNKLNIPVIWQNHWFVIGEDGSGNYFFINTSEDDSKIYELDHEQILASTYNPLQNHRFESLGDVVKSED